MATHVRNFPWRFLQRRKVYFDGISKRVFHSFGIKELLLKRLKKISIEKPTAIQEKALGPVLEGKNTVINAETGSGKTLCYLLPITNKLLSDKKVLSRPPYAVVLLPSIELCHQVANVFQSLSDNSMLPCIVHRESKLLINPKYPIILATPNALFNYRLGSLNNVQVVVTDEADFLITGGGDELWEILSFFKGVDSMKTKKRQKRLARRQMVSRQHNATEDEKLCNESTRQIDNKAANVPCNSGKELSHADMVTSPSPKRQFIFVAATLPHNGPKSAFKVLEDWVPDASFVSTDLAHHTVPTVGIFYVSVHEAEKLPELLHYLNALVGLIQYPSISAKKRGSEEVEVKHQENVGSGTTISFDQEKTKEVYSTDYLDSHKAQTKHQAQQEIKEEFFLETVSLENLKVLVFANSTKSAERAFNFLSDNKKLEESDLVPWKHETQKGVTITTWRVEDDDISDEDVTGHFVTHTGSKDFWMGRVGLIHKKLPIPQRIETLNKFKLGELKVLICTDLAARGLDIQDVSHVIQMDFAPNAAQVLHRTGRTARAGASGKVINFVTEDDEDLAMAIQTCEDSPNSKGYQTHFSRNRQFRWRLKKKQHRKQSRQAKEV